MQHRRLRGLSDIFQTRFLVGKSGVPGRVNGRRKLYIPRNFLWAYAGGQSYVTVAVITIFKPNHPYRQCTQFRRSGKNGPQRHFVQKKLTGPLLMGGLAREAVGMARQGFWAGGTAAL